jgi:hypothetical protein
MDGQEAQVNEPAIWDAHFVDLLFFAVCYMKIIFAALLASKIPVSIQKNQCPCYYKK